MWIAFGNVLGMLYLVDISWFEAPGASEQMAANSQEVESALDCMNIQYDVDADSSGKGKRELPSLRQQSIFEGENKVIHGNLVTLKPFTREMFNTYYQWRQDDEVMYWATGEPYMSSLISEEAFMKRYDTDVLENRQQESGMLGIFTETDDFIGEISYRDMDLVAGTAVIGIMIGNKDFWGKGYGTDAVRTMCQFLFDRFRLRRLR